MKNNSHFFLAICLGIFIVTASLPSNMEAGEKRWAAGIFLTCAGSLMVLGSMAMPVSSLTFQIPVGVGFTAIALGSIFRIIEKRAYESEKKKLNE